MDIVPKFFRFLMMTPPLTRNIFKIKVIILVVVAAKMAIFKLSEWN